MPAPLILFSSLITAANWFANVTVSFVPGDKHDRAKYTILGHAILHFLPAVTEETDLHSLQTVWGEAFLYSSSPS